MPIRQKTSTGMVRPHLAGSIPAGPAVAPHSPRSFPRKRLLAAALVAVLTGCATLTEPVEQYVMVQTVLDHQQVAGVGCVLANDAGRWFVTSPGRVRIRKSTQPLAVDCRLNDVYVYDQVSPKQNSSRWGNILLTAGTGQFIDRSTGAGFDYPSTLTVLLRRVEPAPPAVPVPPPAAPPAPPPKPPEPVQPPPPPLLPGGTPIN